MQFLKGYAAFLQYRYWLNLHPIPLGPSLVGGIFAFFGWFAAAAVVLKIVSHFLKKRRPLQAGACRRFARLLGTTGLLGWLFLFFTYEQLPILGMRLWFLLIFVMFMVWLVGIVVYLVRDYPAALREVRERERFEKYLPAKKK